MLRNGGLQRVPRIGPPEGVNLVSYSYSAKQRKKLEEENQGWPAYLVQIPENEWPDGFREFRMAVWRSSGFLVQIFEPRNGGQRMTVSKTFTAGGTWLDGITWDELQQLKKECGFGDRWAVEIYPPDAEIVNVSNMRHLWILEKHPAFAWRK